MIRQIFFDIDDTLYDQQETFRLALDQLFSGRYPEALPYRISDSRKEDADFLSTLYQRFRFHSDAVFHETETGSMSVSDMRVYRITEAFRDLGLDLDRTSAELFQTIYEDRQHHLRLLPDMEQLLSSLCNLQITLGIITNGPSRHQWDKVRCLGLEKWIPHDLILISDDLGISKPDPAVFHTAEKITGIPASDSWYVGDAYLLDVCGARNAGWHVLWLNRRHRAVPEGMTILPDAVVTTDSECLSFFHML